MPHGGRNDTNGQATEGGVKAAEGRRCEGEIWRCQQQRRGGGGGRARESQTQRHTGSAKKGHTRGLPLSDLSRSYPLSTSIRSISSSESSSATACSCAPTPAASASEPAPAAAVGAERCDLEGTPPAAPDALAEGELPFPGTYSTLSWLAVAGKSSPLAGSSRRCEVRAQ